MAKKQSPRAAQLDRIGVELWIARTAVQTAQTRLKDETKRAQLDAILDWLVDFRARIAPRDVCLPVKGKADDEAE